MTTPQKRAKKSKFPIAPAAPKARIDVRKAIRIDIVLDGPSAGWVHTHGLDRFGLPELELRNVPRLWWMAAGQLLDDTADYLLNSATKPLLPNQKARIGVNMFRTMLAVPDDTKGYAANHYEVMRLTLDAQESQPVCACCAAG